MQNPQRSFSGRRTTGTKTDTLPRTVRSWIFLIIMRAHPASKLGEGATAVTGAELCERLFQSTPPARGATAPLHHGHAALGISIHAPREGGDLTASRSGFSASISIHAPREGGDCLILWTRRCRRYFNPRPPRGGRPKINRYNVYNKGFQSTPPARGATAATP